MAYVQRHIYFQLMLLLYCMHCSTVLDTAVSQMAHFPLVSHRCVNKHLEVTLQEVRRKQCTLLFLSSPGLTEANLSSQRRTLPLVFSGRMLTVL